MIWSRIWPWASSRSKKAPVRRTPERTRLQVELLETRLVPSTTTDPAYDAWRSETFHVDDVAVADVVNPTSVSGQATPTNSSFGSLIGLPSAFTNTSYRGTGYSVVVIDTGIDYRDTDLGGGFGAGYRVIAGWDFVNNDADPMDDNGHGTHVAGIIGSSNATYSGVAPNVNLIALKVLDANGSGSFGAVEDALKWVVANQSKYNIVAINMSLGSGNYTTNPYTFLDDEFTSLKNQGVFISVAAGNSFYSNNSQVGLDYPAVDPLVVSVGAVWTGNFGTVAWASGARDETTAADRIASFSQRGPALSIMAPGAIINSTYLNNTYKTMAGTSMASPVVAGAAAILHQAMDAMNLTANQDTILALMKKTGKTVIDGDDENDNVVNTGLSFKRLDLGAALADLGPAVPTNSAPVLQAIGTQYVSPGQSIVVTLNATDADGDAITYSARMVGSMAQAAYQLDQQLGLGYTGTYSENTFGLGERWMSGSGGKWYFILPNGELRVWAGSLNASLQPAGLIAAFDVQYYNDPSLLWNAQASTGLVPTLAIAGNELTITAPATIGNDYTIEVTASDGKASAKTTFIVSAKNASPVLSPISGRSVLHGSTTTISLSATDADGDPITYSARVSSSQSQTAYELDQKLGLGFSGSYQQNSQGQSEKWMTGSNGSWYWILPNGEVRLWGGSVVATMQASNLVGKLDARFYYDPSLLWNAQPNTGAAPSLSIVGNQLTISAPSTTSGSYTIEVTASDGKVGVKQTFVLNVTNSAPTLQAIADQSVIAGSTATVNLVAGDADNDAITYSARIVNLMSQTAYQLDQQLGLGFSGSYAQNAIGLNEKWMTGKNGTQYCILPNGDVRLWGGSAIATMQASNLVGKLDARFYSDPSLLWNAQLSSAPLPTMTIVGGQLQIPTSAAFSETYQIEVTASDGVDSVKRTFSLSVRANTPAAITPISTQSMLTNRSQTIPVVATDAQGNPVTLQAKIVGSFASPPASLSLVGNVLTINTSPDFVGSFDVQVSAVNGSLAPTTFRVNVTASAVFSRMQADVNGDGRTDTIFFNQDGSVWVNLPKADGSFVNNLWANWQPASAWKSVSAADFDGDGKADIMAQAADGAVWVGKSSGTNFGAAVWSQAATASSWAKILVADFNGDGKADILGFSTGGSVWVGLSNGSNFSTSLWTQWSGYANWKSLSVADVNGDGKQDLIGLNADGRYYVAYSTATDFNTTLWTQLAPPIVVK